MTYCASGSSEACNGCCCTHHQMLLKCSMALFGVHLQKVVGTKARPLANQVLQRMRAFGQMNAFKKQVRC